MATIPSNQKFVTIRGSEDTKERKSFLNNSATEVYTIADLISTIGPTEWGTIGGTLSAQTDLQTALNGKQDTLISGTTIKTINSQSLLGSGDISISATSAWGGITGTLSAQTDLQTALDGKVNTTGNETIGGAKTFSSAPVLSSITSNSVLFADSDSRITDIVVSNGLTAAAGIPNRVKLGGTLIEDTTITNGVYDLIFSLATGSNGIKAFNASAENILKITGDGQIAIGRNAVANNINNVAIGRNANTTADEALSIGRDTSAATRCVSIGHTVNYVSGSESINFGLRINGRGGSIALGRDLTAGVGNNLLAGINNNQGTRVQGGGHTFIGHNINTAATATGFNAANISFFGNTIRLLGSANFGSDFIGLGSYIDINSTNGGNIVIGSGTSASRLLSNIDNSLIIGFKSNTPSLFFNKNAVLLIATTTAPAAGTNFESAATNTIYLQNGVNPTTPYNNIFSFYSSDAIGAGTAAPHFFTEDSKTIILYPFNTYGAPTGTATRTTFDTATVTTSELAERVKALIDDLQQNGLIG